MFWAGPGSPVVALVLNLSFDVVPSTPGRTATELYTGYLTNRTVTGLIAQAIGGVVITIKRRSERRSCAQDLLAAHGPLDRVLSGGSYSAALAAWTESTAPGTFSAYRASSTEV